LKKKSVRTSNIALVCIIGLIVCTSPFGLGIHHSMVNKGICTSGTALYNSLDQITFVSKSTGLDIPAKDEGKTGLELADINNDGHPDIISVGDHGSPYVGSQQHGIMVWLGDGNGVWTVYQNGNFGYGGCAAGDLNLDGHLDVIWGIHHNYGPVGFGDTLIGAALGDGTGMNWSPWAIGLGTGGETWGMFESDLADFNNDGYLDIVSQSFGASNGYHVYRNNGDGTWTHMWSLTGDNCNWDLKVCDINADGFMDFVGTRWGTNVLLGDGVFHFTLHQNGLPSTTIVGLDVGDFNNDGCDDLVASYSSLGIECFQYNPQNSVWVSTSNGLPTTGTYYVQFGDMNGDGHLDIVGYSAPTGRVYLGDGIGNWVADATFSMPTVGSYSAFRIDGDFDHDGREDVLIQAAQGSWPTYQNQLRAFSPWLEPGSLSVQIQSPNGGETLRSGSIRMVRWLAAVPPSQGQATVTLQLSLAGDAGPWQTFASNIPNNGRYQWKVCGSESMHCRLKIIVSTSSSSASAISSADFTILGFNAYAHGPYEGSVGEPVYFTGSAENGTPPYSFHWEFGDGNTSDEQNPTHIYAAAGNYTATLLVTEATGLTASDAAWVFIYDTNTPPEIPTINGPTNGKKGQAYLYTFTTIDPEEDDIYYYIDWGDNTNSGWIGPYLSDTEVSQQHTWLERGTYTIQCKARDVHGAESDWGVLQVKMPLSVHLSFLPFFQKLIERHPLLFPLLRHLLKH
jgi:hypothetical protein